MSASPSSLTMLQARAARLPRPAPYAPLVLLTHVTCVCLHLLQSGLLDSVRKQAHSPEEGDKLAQEIQQLVRWGAGRCCLAAVQLSEILMAMPLQGRTAAAWPCGLVQGAHHASASADRWC